MLFLIEAQLLSVTTVYPCAVHADSVDASSRMIGNGWKGGSARLEPGKHRAGQAAFATVPFACSFPPTVGPAVSAMLPCEDQTSPPMVPFVPVELERPSLVHNRPSIEQELLKVAPSCA